jgi:hypothetical protein
MPAIVVLLLAHGPAAQTGVALTDGGVPLPAYRPGTTFVYADGSWETVVSAAAGDVTWQDDHGFLSSGSADFTRRRARWETATRRGTRAFSPREDLFVSGAASLWPLEPGRATHFKETGSWSENGGPMQIYTALWSCEVAGRQAVSVPAGSFDTWKIDCSRFSLFGVGASYRLWETLTWYYAPAAGHYVLAVSKDVDEPEPRRKELLAVLPPVKDLPAAARRRMEESLQQALESDPSNRARAWASPEVGVSGDTTPAGTFRSADGTFCRRYVQRIDDPAAGRREYYGMACRAADGRWEVFRR